MPLHGHIRARARPLLAAALAALVPASASADGGTAAGPGPLAAQARLSIQIRIPAIASVRSGGHARHVDIRAEDVARGFVGVRYRIRLAPGVAPGVYPWPVFLRLEVA